MRWLLQGEDWEFEEDRQDDDLEMQAEHLDDGSDDDSDVPDRGGCALASDQALSYCGFGHIYCRFGHFTRF